MPSKCCGYDGEPCWDCPDIHDPEFGPIYPADPEPGDVRIERAERLAEDERTAMERNWL